jgi:TetR/AcrR family transcriptional regulator, regulator of autoinduction and epiphytic fitness
MTQQAIADGRTARRDRNRLAVLDAVLEIFTEGDLSPSPEAVAQRSGLSLRSVYRYVSDSDDLVRAAIDRHLEKVGPLFSFEPIGQGSFNERVDVFVSARLRLHKAIAPAARAAQARTRMRATPASEIIRESLHARRGMLRVQLGRQFEPELTTFGAQADAILAAADALTQIETIDWFVVDGGYTVEQTRDALVTGLHRLLAPGAAPEPSQQGSSRPPSRADDSAR